MPIDSRRRQRVLTSGALAGVLAAVLLVHPAGWTGPEPAGQQAARADCVDIATPNPSAVFTYRLTQSSGAVSQYTHQWESVTPTGARVRVNGPQGVEYRTNQHRIVDDAAVLDRTSKSGPKGALIDATAFKPGLVMDPAFRACAGRSWQIQTVTATYQSGTQKATASTPAGTLRIVALREKTTVPAGTFETVRYVRTSQSTDEYWKSIVHGVVVKHVGKLPNGVVTEELIAIK